MNSLWKWSHFQELNPKFELAMFTPRRQWPGVSGTPKSEARGTPTATGKGKRTAFIEGPPPPPTGLLNDSGNVNEVENMEDWRRFREVGLLDKAELERRDRQALLERMQKLENEVRRKKFHLNFCKRFHSSVFC